MSRLRGLRPCPVVLGVLLLAACAGANHPAGNAAAGTFQPATPGVLTVATDEIPETGFWEGSAANPTGGFEWELARALAERFKLDRVEVSIIPFVDLAAGRIENADLVLSQLTPTRERELNLRFSEPYLPATPAVLVRAGTRVGDMASARQKRWAVRMGSTLERFLGDTIRPDEAVLALLTRRESVDALTGGVVDAVLLDLPAAAAISSASSGTLEVAGQFAADDRLAVALRRGSANAEAVDSAVRALLADGTIDRLADRWLGAGINGRAADDVPLIVVPA